MVYDVSMNSFEIAYPQPSDDLVVRSLKKSLLILLLLLTCPAPAPLLSTPSSLRPNPLYMAPKVITAQAYGMLMVNSSVLL